MEEQTFSPSFWLVLSAFQGEAISEKRRKREKRETSEPGCSPHSSPTASLRPASLQQSFQDSSSLFFHFLLHQIPQISMTAASDLFFKIIFYIYMCIFCGCHLVYKLERGQAWSGSAAGSPRSALCCRKHFTLSISNCHYHFATPAENPGQARPGVTPRQDFCPALPWHGATALSQSPATTRFISCRSVPFPSDGEEDQARRSCLGYSSTLKPHWRDVPGINALSETSNPSQSRDTLGSVWATDISWEILPGPGPRALRMIKSTFSVTQFLCSVIKNQILISLMVIQALPTPVQVLSLVSFEA